jgi:hypothetical protein
MRIKVATLFLVLSIIMPAHARGPYGSIRVAGWSGGAFTNDRTGQFSNCIASATYKSGINFGVVVSSTMTWALAFNHQNFNLAAGHKYPLVLSFDGRNTFNVDGVAVPGAGIIVPMPDNSSLIQSFRAARTMTVLSDGKSVQFNLTGTSVLLPALVTCVKTINESGLNAAGDFTAPILAAKAAKQAPPPTTASSLTPNMPQEGSAEYQLEAMQIASNFIIKASLDHPALLSRSETPVSVASKSRQRDGLCPNCSAPTQCSRVGRCCYHSRKRCEEL